MLRKLLFFLFFFMLSGCYQTNNGTDLNLKIKKNTSIVNTLKVSFYSLLLIK